jgi:hypothetical protein
MARGKHSGNGHEKLHITETPDVSHIKNPDVTHEASDVSVSGVAKFVLALTVLGVVVFVLMWGMFRLLNAQETEKEPPAGPMAMKPTERLPPPPRLQAAPGFEVKLKSGETVSLEKKEPEAEYNVLLAQWEDELKCSEGTGTGTTAGGHETGAPKAEPHPAANEQEARAPAATSIPAGCVPIGEAMKKVIGLPSRLKQISGEGPGGIAEDYGIDRPTAASSGRATERGRE